MLHTKVQEFSIGPAFDPYGATKVVARDGTKTAEFYFDGLGDYHIELIDGELLIRHERWFDCYGVADAHPNAVKARAIALKARLLFKRFIGADMYELLDEWQHQPKTSAPRIWM